MLPEALALLLTSSIAQAVVIVGGAAIAAVLFRFGMRFIIDRSAWLTATGLDDIVEREIASPGYLTILLVGVYMVFPLFDRPRIAFWAEGVIGTVLVGIWAIASIRLVKRSINAYQENGYELDFAPVLTNLWTFVVLVLAAGLLLGIWGIDLTPFIAGAGVAGIVIGIAAQDTIGNFFAGISLNLDRTYQVGDIIQLEDDTRGRVTSISIRSTSLLTRDNMEVAIPNSYLNNTQVINESAPVRKRRIRLNVGVAYGSDLDRVQSVLLEVMEDVSIVLSDPTPVVRFRAFENSAIRAQLQFYIEHPSQWGRSRHQVIKQIDAAFKEANIKIPFPQRELSFLDGEGVSPVEGEASAKESRPIGFDQ